MPVSCFGLAVITKGQYGLLLPALVTVAALEMFYFKDRRGAVRTLVTLSVAAVCFCTWLGVQWCLVGPDKFGAHLDAIRSSSRVTVGAFNVIRFLPEFGLSGTIGIRFRCGAGIAVRSLVLR